MATMTVGSVVRRSRREYDKMLDDPGSIIASLESVDPELLLNPPMDDLHSESDPESEASETPFSPPGWRKAASGFQRHHRSESSTSGVRDSPDLDDDIDDTISPARIPLPASPAKQTPAPTADPVLELHRPTEDRAMQSPERDDREESIMSEPPSKNFIRFAVRAEVQHRTDPIESAIEWIRTTVDGMKKMRASTIVALVVFVFALSIGKSILLSPPEPFPSPDITRATHVARNFEPLIYHSQSGMQQVGDLQSTGIALWDLGESVRTTNLTSAPLIVSQLDELGQSLDTLVIELTRFFVSVDGDIDSILQVMEWAKRRLQTITPQPTASVSIAVDNVHLALGRFGLLEANGKTTVVGHVVKSLIGQTAGQRNMATLQHTFNEFLNVLEESIDSELKQSIELFAHFEAIDRQFMNLHRTVVRESDLQEHEEGEFLSNLWNYLLKNRSSQIKKFEKNKVLLLDVRNRTLNNKHALKDHNKQLLVMKSNLEFLRRKIASNLLRSNESVIQPIEDQIKGLDDTYTYLKDVREAQKRRMRDKQRAISDGTAGDYRS